MLKNILLFSLIIISFLSVSCRKIFGPDDKLSLKKESFSGNQLRINGYYFFKYGNPEYHRIYFFYNNGVVLEGETPLASELQSTEDQYRNGTYYNRVKEIKYYWGIYVVDGDRIKFEKWYPSGPPVQAFVRSGEILNDSTFHISKSIRSNGEDESDENETYQFKQFTPKPDSTNRFVE